jgi:hypothetical protein
MNKNSWLKIINPVLFISLLLQAVTVVILLSGENPAVEEIHKYNGMFFVALIIIHTILNWAWIKANFFRR